MTTKNEAKMTNLFDQAVQTLGDAVKAGVKIQEEVARWWGDIMDQSAPLQEWQKRSRAIVSEALPAAEKNAEEWMSVMQENYKRSLGLFKKAMNGEQPAAISEIQAKSQELWEATLDVVRDNAQAVAQVNSKTMENFAQILKKNFSGEPAAV